MRSFSLSRPGVILVEHVLGARQVDHLVGSLAPRQRDDPVEIGARHGELGGGRRHLRQAIELAQRFLLDHVGQAGRVELLAQLVDLARLIVAFAQFLLDRLELLAQEVVALVLADLGLHLRLNLRPELEHLELLDQLPVQQIQAGAHVERGEHFLLGIGADGAEAGGDEVRQPPGLGDVDGERLQVVRHQRRQRDDLLEVRLDVALERVDLQFVLVTDHFWHLGDTRLQIRARRRHLVEADAGHALDDDAQAAVGQLEHLVDVAGGADRMQILLLWIILGGFALSEHGDHPARRHRFVDETDGALARHGERHEGLRKQHGVAQWKHRDFRRHGYRQLIGARRTR